jgi:CheY-like chemotaxis protein
LSFFTGLPKKGAPEMENPMKGRIFVVDDQKEIIDTLVYVLEMWGLDVQSALNGARAVDMFAAQLFDVVITDIRMPGLNGFELIDQLQAIDSEVQFIVLTGYYTDENKAKAFLNPNVSAFIAKPLERIGDLQMAIEKALAKRQQSGIPATLDSGVLK